MIRDLYDNSIEAYKTASHQTVNLVLDTIRLAMKAEKKKVAAELWVCPKFCVNTEMQGKIEPK